MTEYLLGIDTSNYTTSLALVDTDGNLIANVKRPLPVKAGECGLRQSDAVFFHTKNLPDGFAEIRAILAGARPVAVGVSGTPRRVTGSYMPCFLSGVAAANAVSASLGIPLYTFSHQCGHIMAAVYSSGKSDLLDAPFGAFHVSGGTTDLVRASYEKNGFNVEAVGGTLDCNAGQIVDRIGVFLGLPFPAGPHLEKLALTCDKKPPKPHLTVKGTFVSLSGLENQAKKLYADTSDAPLTALFTLKSIAYALGKMAEGYLAKRPNDPLLFAGGVMCNSIIRKELSRFGAAFAEPALSADNAVGIACLTRTAYLQTK